jgi:hypothetical protein
VQLRLPAGLLCSSLEPDCEAIVHLGGMFVMNLRRTRADMETILHRIRMIVSVSQWRQGWLDWEPSGSGECAKSMLRMKFRSLMDHLQLFKLDALAVYE